MLLAAESPGAADARYDAAGVIFYLEVPSVTTMRDALQCGGHDVSPVEVTFYGMRVTVDGL